MKELLLIENFGLTQDGPVLTTVVEPGQLLIVTGRAGSGKTHFAEALAGEEQPVTGKVKFKHRPALVQEYEPRRGSPRVDQILGQAKGAKPDLVGEALYACKLWERRSTGFDDLSATQRDLLDIAMVLCSEQEVVIIDGYLDGLDIFVLDSLWKYLHERLSRGMAAVLTTNNLKFLAEADEIVVLDEQNIKFTGSYADLLRKAAPTQTLVHTENRSGARALVDPFVINVRETDEGLLMQSASGQKLAAKMLVEGYNDVRLLIQKPPSIEDAIRAVLGTA